MNEQALLFAGIGLLAVSVLLIVVEAFIPSGGVIGAVALVAAVGGIVVLFRFNTGWGVAGILVTIVLLPATFFFAISTLPSTPFGRRLIGEPTEQELADRQAREQALLDEFQAMVGLEGVALTDLKPVGQAKIAGKRYDVLAEGGLIEAGSRIRVTKAQPSMIKVRAVRQA